MALVVACMAMLAAGLIATPVASAQEPAQEPEYTLEIQVDGTDVRVIITDVVTPVGALEVDIVGLPPLATECALTSGFGACSEADGVVRLVAVNAIGWGETAELMTATMATSADPSQMRLEIARGTDVNGVDMPGAVLVTEGFPDAEAGSGWLNIGAAAVVVLAVLGLGVTAVRRGSSRRVADSAD